MRYKGRYEYMCKPRSLIIVKDPFKTPFVSSHRDLCPGNYNWGRSGKMDVAVRVSLQLDVLVGHCISSQ
jgi:hypothetical protein